VASVATIFGIPIEPAPLSIYGMPIEEVPIPCGFAYVFFRTPLVDEWYLSRDGRVLSFYHCEPPSTFGSRIILRAIAS
jgi:hypothetical protein